MPTVTGTIRNPNNSVGVVSFQLIKRSVLPTEVAVDSGSFFTNSSGVFSLPLEPGNYDLVLPTSDVLSFKVPNNSGTFNITSILD